MDVDNAESGARAACVGFSEWEDKIASFEWTWAFEGAPSAYEPGHFHRRELPYLLALLESLEAGAALVVIDGFVWLEGGGQVSARTCTVRLVVVA